MVTTQLANVGVQLLGDWYELARKKIEWMTGSNMVHAGKAFQNQKMQHC